MMRTNHLVPIAVSLGMLLAATVGSSDAQDGERIVPVYEEPRHRQVFESGTTRILHLQVHPGDTTLFHTHSEPILYVAFGTSETRNQPLGGQWTVAQNALPFTAPPPGVMSVTTYAQQAVTHRINNAGKRLFELVAVLNATPGDGSRTPQDAGFTGTPELTNSWYRAYRFTVPAGQTARHEHSEPTVLVQTTVGSAVGSGRRVYGFNGPTSWGYFDAQEPHEVRNTGSSSLEFVEVEVRQPRK